MLGNLFKKILKIHTIIKLNKNEKFKIVVLKLIIIVGIV